MTRNLLVSVENLVDNEKQLQAQNPGTFFQSVSENIQKFYKEKIVVLFFSILASYNRFFISVVYLVALGGIFRRDLLSL